MHPDIKQLWLDALRSGEYVQGRGNLRITAEDGTFTYCCLGVLCDLFQKQTDKGEWREKPEGFHKSASAFIVTDWEFDNPLAGYPYESATQLPGAILVWAGLDSNDPHVGSTSLARLNDGEFNHVDGSFSGGLSYEQIAEIIEERF